MIYLDRTFCSSLNCKNKCGRKMTTRELSLLRQLEKTDPPQWVAYAKFCEEPVTSKSFEGVF